MGIAAWKKLETEITFSKVLSGISSECKTDWIQTRQNIGPDLGPICL